MTSLVFNEISILSKLNKKARSVTFDPSVNLITGENDVGKSTLIKSLYNTLGADVPGFTNAEWKSARPICRLNFTFGSKQYYILRDERFFSVFDANKMLIDRYTSISGEKGVAKFVNNLLGFRIELERQEDDSKLGPAGPAYYFLPFYIDQDRGWTQSWASFVGLPQFKTYRKSMIEYHLGVRPQSFYDNKKKLLELTDGIAKLQDEKNTLVTVREAYFRRKASRQIDIDPAAFKREVELLVESYNQVSLKQQEVLRELRDARNERHSIEHEIAILRRAIDEMNADYTKAESPETPDPVPCPTCGTEFANSIVERFGILDDIDNCFNLLDQRTKKRMDVSVHIEKIERRYEDVSKEVAVAQQILSRTRENVTFAEMIAAEGLKDVMASMSADIQDIEQREGPLQVEIDELNKTLKVDGKRKKEIVRYYQERMAEFLNLLNVSVLKLSDYKTLEKQVGNNALGSDLSRSLLAQSFAFLHTMNKFTKFVVCPLVIDSPFQQEQDDTNVDAIFKFIFSKVLPQQQLFLATLTVHTANTGVVPTGAKEVHLLDELALLQSDQYADVLKDVGPMHDATLAES